jgi:ribokinase
VTGGVLIVGGANLDLIVRADRLPAPGETLLASDHEESPGGKAANLAAAAAAWGAPTRFVGRIGEDAYGDVLLAAWRDVGVDTTFVRRDRRGTGLGIVFMDRHGAYQTMVVARANATLAADDVASLPQAAWDGVAVLALALEAPPQALLAAARAAVDRGVTVVLNAAPAEGMIADLWPCVTVLIVNLHEAALLSGVSVGDGVSAIQAAHTLLSRLAPDRVAAQGGVIVTLGADGAVLVTPDAPPRAIPAPRVTAIDTLGAGDTFVGVIAAELAAGRPLAVAAPLACRAASLAVTAAGARANVTQAALARWREGNPA